MSAKFNEKEKTIGAPIHDETEINGRIFHVEVVCSERNKSKNLQGGKIFSFMLSESDIDIFNGGRIIQRAISFFENGQWKIRCPEEDDEACIAQTYFIEKYRKANHSFA